MSLETSTIPSNYRTSKSGRLGRALDEDAREQKQAQDDEGPRELVTRRRGRTRERILR